MAKKKEKKYKHIHFSGVITSHDRKSKFMTQKLLEKIMDGFIDVVEKYKCGMACGMELSNKDDASWERTTTRKENKDENQK